MNELMRFTIFFIKLYNFIIKLKSLSDIDDDENRILHRLYCLIFISLGDI